MLKRKVKLVRGNEAICFSIACNTAHILLPKLQAVSKVPFVSMIEEVVGKVNQDEKKKVGLLGTPSTIRYGLYQNALKKYGVEIVVPYEDEIKVLERIIRNVIGGKLLQKDTDKLKKIADRLVKEGAEGIILGCTELPLVFPKRYKKVVYSSLEILALALLRKYYKKP